MSTPLDVTRVVRSWLRTDEHESADRVLEIVLALVDTTPQRRSPWPVRRLTEMNALTKLAATAAAVVAVAVVGLALLRPGATGPAAVASPTPSPTSTPAPTSASPSQIALRRFPADGPLPVGRQTMVRSGVPMSFTLTTTGWSADQGVFAVRGPDGSPETTVLAFWERANTNVYGDPCKLTPLSPAPAQTRAGLAAAVTKVPLVQVVSGPTDVTIGGFPASHVAIRVADALPCEPHSYVMWYERDPVSNWRYVTALGMTFDVWIIDHDGSLIWIDGETYKGAAPARRAELQQIIDSIQFD